MLTDDLAAWLAEKGPRFVHTSKLPGTCQIWSCVILRVGSASAVAIAGWNGLSQLLWLDELALGQLSEIRQVSANVSPVP